MRHEEIILATLHISLRIARAKKDLFEKKNVTIPTTLLMRIANTEAAIKERESKV